MRFKTDWPSTSQAKWIDWRDFASRRIWAIFYGLVLRMQLGSETGVSLY